ncbi:hypothetical protein ACJRO7_017096 [Eucalyptus globulus]|uniref:Uncharacterized protein n=1 Tax=Eucalyptus globulus TaxID=34317 RepID=A0ABD3KP18_EUCGL
MNAKSCTALVVVMLVATMALQASVARANALCEAKCWTLCAPNPTDCLDDCLRKCGSKVETAQGQCNLGCLISKCRNPHLDAKEACANSCAEGCKQSYANKKF